MTPDDEVSAIEARLAAVLRTVQYGTVGDAPTINAVLADLARLIGLVREKAAEVERLRARFHASVEMGLEETRRAEAAEARAAAAEAEAAHLQALLLNLKMGKSRGQPRSELIVVKRCDMEALQAKAASLAQAVAAERERCAKVAEERGKCCGIATAIREGR
jgi:hypothetical protein